MARIHLFIAAAAIGLVGAAGSARAQLWPPKMRAPGLTQGDIDAGREATRPLFTDAASPGQSLAWSNPGTGNSGYATYERAVRVKGLACRAVRYDIDLVKPARKRVYSVNWCMTKDGWKIG